MKTQVVCDYSSEKETEGRSSSRLCCGHSAVSGHCVLQRKLWSLGPEGFCCLLFPFALSCFRNRQSSSIEGERTRKEQVLIENLFQICLRPHADQGIPPARQVPLIQTSFCLPSQKSLFMTQLPQPLRTIGSCL